MWKVGFAKIFVDNNSDWLNLIVVTLSLIGNKTIHANLFGTFVISNGRIVWLINSKLCSSRLYFINYTMKSYRDSDWQNYKQTVITFTSKIPFAVIGHRTGFHLQGIILKVFIIHALQLKCFWTCGMKNHRAVYVCDHLVSELKYYTNKGNFYFKYTVHRTDFYF